MAGPCSIKILLLCAGIIGVADCQYPAANVKPANTSNETTPTITSTSNQTVSQALGNQTQTPPPITQSNTTVTPTTEAPTPPPPPQCSYTVTPIKFGLEIKFINSPPGNYTINVKEEGQNQIGGKGIFQHSNPNITTHNIRHLKPCTDYKHDVTFDYAGTKILCDHSDDKTTVATMEMTKADIEPGSCIPEYLCYKSDWNISSVQINNIEAVQCPSDNKTFCIKPGYHDICTNLTTTFTQAKCVNFSLIQHISAAEFLNSSEINVTLPTKLPAKIEANLPPKCTDLTIDYICSDSDNKTMNVSELEPFTKYTCTGHIKENDFIIKNKTDIQFKIDCDLNIITQRDSTNTSIELSWTTTSQNCPEVPKLDGLSYNCSCHPVGSTSDKKRAKRQIPSAITNPAITSNETTPTITSTSNQTVSQALGNQTQTSPPITQSITTVTLTTEAPPPPQCSYTVTPIKFGFQINFKNSSLGNYTVNVKEEGQVDVQHFNQSPPYIRHLKPCTVYEHNVTFDHAGKEILCNHSDNHTTVTTMEITESDIKLGNCTPGYLCYKSDWNISSVQITSNNIEAKRCRNDNKKFCIRLDENDICTNLTTTFTQEKCVNFSLTQHISAAEFLNPSEINLIPPTKLPAKIEANLPPKCTDLTIDYICSDSDNKTKLESELEPFTDYNCTGQIKENNVTIKNTSAIQFKIDCDLNIATQRDSTNTSIELSWTTTSQNCSEVPKLYGLSYNCSCHPVGSTSDKKRAKLNKQRPGGACHFSGLKPYTDYTCEVQPTYNNKKVAKPTEVKEKTEPGVPDDIVKLLLSVPEHNVIKVTCPGVKDFCGPKKLYNATLSYNNDVIEEKKSQNKCEFTFKDLSYSTTYDVEVVAFNGYLSSKTKTERVSTLYNDKALIGFLVFLIILTSVAVLWGVYKIYMMKRRNSEDVYDDVMLESTAIYANVPQWHQNERR